MIFAIITLSFSLIRLRYTCRCRYYAMRLRAADIRHADAISAYADAAYYFFHAFVIFTTPLL